MWLFSDRGQMEILWLQCTTPCAPGLIPWKSMTWCKLLGRIRHFCHCQHRFCIVLEGSAASGEWEELHVPCDQSLTRSEVLNCYIWVAIVSCYNPADFYERKPLISVQTPLPNQLTLFPVNILAYFYILRHLRPIFKKNQKQRLVVIIWFLKIEC